MDPAFVAGAMTSPTGSMPGDMAWTDNGGKRTPVFYPHVNPYAYMPTETKIRGWNCVPVPALSQKRAGKVIYKRAIHAYPTPLPVADSDTQQAKRVCTTPPIIRDAREHEYHKTGVENAGFWDMLSAKVHTRNALYTDRVLPVGNRILSLSREKRCRDPSGYAAALGQPLTPTLLSSLESMSDRSVMVIGITDMTDLVCKSMSREGASRRRARLSDITPLTTISECAEPDSPRATSFPSSPAKSKSAKSIWTPVKNLKYSLKKGLAKLSPSSNKDATKQVGVSPSPSAPSLLQSSPLGDNPLPLKEPAKAPPISAESPLRVFTNGKCEASTSSSVKATRRRSLHLQRSRTLSGGRLSLDSQSKKSAIVDGDEATNVDSWLEDSVVQQSQCPDLQSFKVDFDRKVERRLSEPSRALSVNELSVDARTNLDIFSQRPVAAIQSLAKAAAGLATEVPDANVLIERRDGRLVVRFKLPEAYVDQFPTDSLPTSNGSDGTTNVPETPLVSSKSMFTTPRVTLSRPGDVEHSVGDASFMSTDTDALISGLPDTPTMAVLNGDFNTPHARDIAAVLDTPGADNRSVLSTDTDELVGGLPDTPTHIVLNPEANTPQCATKLVTAESTSEHDMTRVSTKTNGPVGGQLETPIAAGNHAGPGAPRIHGGTGANASITWNRVMEDVSFMSTNTDELIGGLPDTPTVIGVDPDLSTPRHAASTAVSSTPACPNTAESNMEDVSFLSTNTDELVGGLPDTPTGIVLDAGSNFPSYEADSDMDEPDETLVDNTMNDQTVAVDIPSSWVGQHSSEPSDGPGSLPGTPMADETLAVDIPSYLTGRRFPALSNGAVEGTAEDIASSASPVSSDIAHNEPVQTSWAAQEQSTVVDAAGHTQADYASTSPVVLDAPREDTRDETSEITVNGISKEYEEHAEALPEVATPSANASEPDGPASPTLAEQTGHLAAAESFVPTSDESTEAIADKLPASQEALAVSGLEECEQSANKAQPPRTDVIGSSPSEEHAQALDDDQDLKSPQSPTASYVQNQHGQSSIDNASESDPILPSPEGDAGAMADEQPMALSQTPPAGEEQQVEQLDTSRAHSTSPVNRSPNATSSESQSLSPCAATGDEPKEADATSPSKYATAASVKTPSPKPARPIPGTLESLLESPFLPPCSGTPGRATTIASPSRALDHQATEPTSTRGDAQKQDDPCEPRETPGAAPPAESENLAEAMEAENKAYLDQFVSQHKASKAAKSASRSPGTASGVTSTGSPKPRLPLGQIDANTSSPKKTGTKRKADDDDAEDDEGLEQAKSPPKRGRRSGSVLKASTTPAASLRRSSRVKARAEAEPAAPEGGSKIPVRVGSGVFGGPAAGGETMAADLASVTRANTRRNKGKAVSPVEVLARQKEDPRAHRMQELKEVHDARAARAGKKPGKGIQWGENHEMIYEAEYDDDDDDDDDDEKVSKAGGKAKEKAPATKKKKAAPVPRGKKKGAAEPKVPKLTKPARVKKAPTQPKTGTPVKRLTRSSARRTLESNGL